MPFVNEKSDISNYSETSKLNSSIDKAVSSYNQESESVKAISVSATKVQATAVDDVESAAVNIDVGKAIPDSPGGASPLVRELRAQYFTKLSQNNVVGPDILTTQSLIKKPSSEGDAKEETESR